LKKAADRYCNSIAFAIELRLVRRRLFHFLFVGFYIFFLGVILPAHDHSWLRIDDGDADDALQTMSAPAKGRANLPLQHDCEHCAFCQFAAHISHSPAMPTMVTSLLPLNYVFIIRPPAYIPADIHRTADARGPPRV
jgi:hypothetical protein